LLDDESVSGTRMARQPFSWPSMAAFAAQAVAVCGYVAAVCALVVGGGIALWPHASEDWILVVWIAAATIAGAGMTAVRSRARALVRRAMPASGRYPTLMSSVIGAVAAGPADVANAAGLLRNAELTERLREQVRLESAQAAELEASRHRVVVARDAAREQLGAEIQARVCVPLERCAVRAELARPGRAESLAGRRLAVELAEMTAAIDAAITDFRKIVHGVYPPALTDHGLLAALENLLSDLDPPAELRTHRIPRLAARVEASAYFCAAAALREWDATGASQPMQVVVGVTATLVQMTFHDGVPESPGRAGLPVGAVVLEAVQDRVAALDGSLRTGRDPSGRWLVIEIPLAPADLAAPPARKKSRR
jgi:signal transduction histidine kinase